MRIEPFWPITENVPLQFTQFSVKNDTFCNVSVFFFVFDIFQYIGVSAKFHINIFLFLLLDSPNMP